MNLPLLKSPLSKFLLKCCAIGSVVLVELIIFLYLKDDSGAYSHGTTQTFTAYLRLHGGIQFLLAAYVQKIFIFSLLIYMLTLGILTSKERHNSLFIKLITKNKVDWVDMAFHSICFLLILAFFLVFKNPEGLVANPRSWPSIIYTMSPIAWALYLYSVFHLVLSPMGLLRLARANKLLVISICLALTAILNPETTFSFIEFWSNLLLKPTISLSAKISDLIGFEAHVLTNNTEGLPVFGTTRFSVEVSPTCSGYEGMSLIALILAFYTYTQRSTLNFTRSLLLIPLAGLAMFALNAIRILALVAIGHYWSPQMAQDGFHSIAGWLNLLIVLVFSLLTLNIVPYFSRHQNSSKPKINEWDKSVLLLPLMALITSGLLIKGVTADFPWLYPIHILFATAIIYFYREYYVSFIVRPTILSLIVGALVFLIWILLIPTNPDINAHFLMQLESAPNFVALGWVAFRVIGAALIVPICEELAFRGYIQQTINSVINRTEPKKIGIIMSVGFTSILFGGLHADMLAGSIAGLFYGMVFLQRKEVGDAVIAHAITNLLLAIYVLWNGYWSYW